MTRQPAGRDSTAMPSPTATARGPRASRALRAASAFYFIAGAIALALTLSTVTGVISAASSGCELFFTREAGDQIDALSESFSCAQYVDVVGTGVTLVVGILLVAMAVRLTRHPERRDLLTAAGTVAGFLAGVGPLLAAIWLVQFYGLSGVVELTIGSIPLALSLLAAWIVWRPRRRT